MTGQPQRTICDHEQGFGVGTAAKVMVIDMRLLRAHCASHTEAGRRRAWRAPRSQQALRYFQRYGERNVAAPARSIFRASALLKTGWADGAEASGRCAGRLPAAGETEHKAPGHPRPRRHRPVLLVAVDRSAAPMRISTTGIAGARQTRGISSGSSRRADTSFTMRAPASRQARATKAHASIDTTPCCPPGPRRPAGYGATPPAAVGRELDVDRLEHNDVGARKKR